MIGGPNLIATAVTSRAYIIQRNSRSGSRGGSASTRLSTFTPQR